MGRDNKSFLVTGKRSGGFQIVCDEREQPTFLAPPTAPLPQGEKKNTSHTAPSISSAPGKCFINGAFGIHQPRGRIRPRSVNQNTRAPAMIRTREFGGRDCHRGVERRSTVPLDWIYVHLETYNRPRLPPPPEPQRSPHPPGPWFSVIPPLFKSPFVAPACLARRISPWTHHVSNMASSDMSPTKKNKKKSAKSPNDPFFFRKLLPSVKSFSTSFLFLNP